MQQTLTLERADEVPADCRVCHYDELGEPAKERLPELAADRDAAGPVDDAAAAAFGDCDVVKFTDYYELSVG